MGVLKNDVGRPSNKTIKTRRILKTVLLVLVLCLIFGTVYVIDKNEVLNVNSNNKDLKYKMTDNSLSDFDLSFLKLENEEKNIIYSPISIKYGLNMLSDATKGNSKNQINSILGEYNPKIYKNSKNLSLANGLFIKDTFKDNINKSYIELIKNKYNGEVIIDSFNTPETVNSWINKNTYGLIDNVYEDVSNYEFILSNSLAIDMDWKKQIQPTDEDFIVIYPHRRFTNERGFVVLPLIDNYSKLNFNKKSDVNSVLFGAVINKYDIVNDLGEEKIKSIVTKAYNEWLDKCKTEEYCDVEDYDDADTYFKDYLKELKTGYKDIGTSTDFRFYDDKDVKVFAKELKEYDGNTFEYIGIMPKKIDLQTYIKNTDSKEINELIKSLKGIKYNNFEDGYVTYIHGLIPLFNFDYDLKIEEDLKKLGVTDVFSLEKSNFTPIVRGPVAIEIKHKSNINFSNDGIKASAALMMGGFGDGGPDFDYIFDMPVKEIDLTFDKPYLFLIRDRDTNEIWFTGTVYEPTLYKETSESAMLDIYN